MKAIKKNTGLSILAILSFVCYSSFAQLPNFGLTVTSTSQTCLGNGTLTFSVSGIQAGAAIGYQVYLLPDTNTPVATVNTSVAANLVAGNYLIIATQTSGTLTNTATATATILNQVVPLVYNVITEPAKCVDDGQIIVDVTSGNAVSYEIISGPELAPPQPSDIFSGLPAGQYQVRVHNNCGNAVVVGALIKQAQTNILIATIGDDYPVHATCDTALVANSYSVTGNNTVFWPLVFEYTVYPPGGGTPVTVTVTEDQPFPDTGSYLVKAEIPFYYNQSYFYNLKVTDACGNVFNEDNNIVKGVMEWEAVLNYDPCLPEYLQLNMGEFMAFPVTVNFIAAPAAFNPSAYNTSHPVFSVAEITYFKQGATVPTGTYVIQVTDACGRSLAKEVFVGPNNLIQVIGDGGNCSLGSIQVLMKGKHADVIEFTAAPPGYPVALPQDLSGFESTGYKIPDLPPGLYTIHVIDECGYEHTEDVLVEVSTVDPLLIFQLPGCTIGEGSVRIHGGGPNITNVIIESAPAAFTETLPYDASANIDMTKIFNMNSLPGGQYTLSVTTECGPNTVELIVKGYSVVKNTHKVIPHCGYFDLELYHSSNAGNLQNFWVQRFNVGQNAWEHPVTGVLYTQGSVFTVDNALAITNNSINTGFNFTGKFRVVKSFIVYTNGEVQLTRCNEVIAEFVFDGEPEIINAYSFPCDNGTADVAIEATGVPPLNYQITSKNGIPFAVDNANSPLFSGLEPATYNFMVSDTCGNLRNIVYDITALDPLIVKENGFCDGQDSELYLPDFPFLIYKWWKEGTPGTILSTTSKLLFPSFDPIADGGIYHVSITTNNPGSCINIERVHEVDTNGLPDAGLDNTIVLCNDGAQIDLSQYLSSSHDSGGTWIDSDVTGALSVDKVSSNVLAPGIYHFGYNVTNGCGLTDDAEIVLQLEAIPAPVAIDPLAPLCEGDDIMLSVPVENGIYEWTGPDGFASGEQQPVITGAGPAAQGIYTVRVMEPGSNCFSQASVIWIEINPVPQFTLEGSDIGCQGQTSPLFVIPANFDKNTATYTWYHEGILMPENSTAAIEAAQPGLYEVTVNYGNCSTSREMDVILSENPFELDIDSGCINYDYMLWVTNLPDIPGATVVWTGPDNFSFTGNEANITRMETGEYTATVSNSEGCSASATITIDNTTCIIPRGISPNGDGLNDSFDLSNLDVIELKIFNRYGLKVYEAHDYLNEWHGQSDKGTLPTATYYYVITLSAGKQVTGWVYLNRQE